MPKRIIPEVSRKAKYILRMARMLYAIEYLGRYCSVCGCDGFDTPWLMDFHHRRGSEKSYEVKNRLYAGSFTDHQSEIDKCILICSNCHRDSHSNKEMYSELKFEILEKLSEIKSLGNRLARVPLQEDVKQEIFELIQSGCTMKEVAVAKGIPYDRVKYLVKRSRLNAERGGKIRIPGSTVIKYLNQKHSIRSIADKLGINRESIRRWISDSTSTTLINGVTVFGYKQQISAAESSTDATGKFLQK